MQEICWIIGRGGLLGRSLQTMIQKKGTEEFVPIKTFDWNDSEICKAQIADAVKTFAHTSTQKRWSIYWAAGTGTMGSSEEELAKETLILTHWIQCLNAEQSLSSRAGTIVYASSGGAIYAGCDDAIITELSAPCVVNAYGRAKYAEENILREFTKGHPHISLLIARISNIYGPAQSTSKRRGLITHIARSILRRQPVNIFVPFDTIRDYITADDAAAAMMHTAAELGNHVMITKIIASEEPTTIARIVGTFKMITSIPPRVITRTSPLSNFYPHRMRFCSIIEPKIQNTTPLLIGISRVLAAERYALMKG